MRNNEADAMPGYRRRVQVVPDEGAVLAMLEDDMHCLAVILVHDGQTVLSVEAVPERMPWNTCPGAVTKLIETFQGLPLEEVTARREKQENCTHFHDLAVIAAAHAKDAAGFVYDISVSDPADGVRILEIRRDGDLLHRWIERDGVLAEPEEIAGQTLPYLTGWIVSLEGIGQEAARLLRWASLVAHGRTMPMEEQSHAAELPPNCYTLQPGRAGIAKRIGDRFDFSAGTRVPLGAFGDRMIATLHRRAG